MALLTLQTCNTFQLRSLCYFHHILNLTSSSNELFAFQLGSLRQCPFSGHCIGENLMISLLWKWDCFICMRAISGRVQSCWLICWGWWMIKNKVFKFWSCHSLVWWSWAAYLTAFHFHFLFCEIEQNISTCWLKVLNGSNEAIHLKLLVGCLECEWWPKKY